MFLGNVCVAELLDVSAKIVREDHEATVTAAAACSSQRRPSLPSGFARWIGNRVYESKICIFRFSRFFFENLKT